MSYSTRKPIDSKVVDLKIKIAHECVQELVNGLKEGNERWRILSDVVNMSETFVTHKDGIWRGCDLKPVTLEDEDNIIEMGVAVLAAAGMRHIQSKEPIQISSEDGAVLLDLIDCYEEIVRLLPHSEVEKCRNITNRRVWEIQRGKRKSHDVVVVSA